MEAKALAIWALIKAHQLGVYIALCAIVSCLPTPRPTSSKAYKQIYYLLHFAAANVGKIIVARWPGVASLLRMILPPDEPDSAAGHLDDKDPASQPSSGATTNDAAAGKGAGQP